MTTLLPPEFNTVTLTGQYVNLDGTPVAGYLTFTASPTVLKASASKDIIVPVQIQAALDGSGHFSVALPATDDPDINPENWTYKVLEGFGSRREYSIQIRLEAGDSQNIFDLAPVSLANGTFYDIGPTGPAGPPALIVSGPPSASTGGTGDYAIDATNGVLYGPKDQSLGWPAGKHLAAADIATHAALATTHGVAGLLVGTTDTQVLSNKILQAPAVTGGLSTDSLTASGAATVGGALAVAGDVSGHDVTGNIGHFVEIQLANAPSAISDAVRKDYVDNTVGTSNSTPNTLVRRNAAGLVAFSGLNLDNAPSDPWSATRKDYVDGQDAALRRPAVNAQTAAYILALSDERKLVQVTSASAQGVTVPPNSVVAFPVGTVIDLLQAGAGSVTAVPGSGVTINAPDNNRTTRGQWSVLRLQKIATDTWVASEDVNSATAQAVSAATDQATAATLVKRDANGDVIVHQASVTAAAPTAVNHLVRKDYVDANFVGKNVSAFNSLETATTLLLDQQAADPTAPTVTGQAALWKANDKGIYVLSQDAAKRRMKTHWGAATSFPTALPGDTVLRTDVGTTGSLWQYTGTTLGASGWIAEGPIVCTSTTRPTGAVLYDGLQIFQTDDKANATYDVANTIWHVWDTVTQTYTPTWTSQAGTPALNGGTVLGRYRRMGTACWIRLTIFGAAGTNWGSGNYSFGLPAGCAAAASATMEQWLTGKLFAAGVGNFPALWGFPDATHLQPWAQTSGSNISFAPAMSLNTAGTAGTGVPSNPSGSTFTAGSNMTCEGTYEMATG